MDPRVEQRIRELRAELRELQCKREHSTADHDRAMVLSEQLTDLLLQRSAELLLDSRRKLALLFRELGGQMPDRPPLDKHLLPPTLAEREKQDSLEAERATPTPRMPPATRHDQER